eukprot:NODE_340_length_9219_cov_0.599452.p1 type:complete len:172 gc:universal NODE_340_length_9219_cov_0.599452:8982-8467(-)
MVILPYNYEKDYYVNNINENRTVLYTDAGNTSYKSSGCNPITKSVNLFDFTSLDINSSTRSEICCILKAIKLNPQGGNLLILTDNMAAIQFIQKYKNYGQINNIDLLSQSSSENANTMLNFVLEIKFVTLVAIIFLTIMNRHRFAQQEFLKGVPFPRHNFVCVSKLYTISI